jgi:uncharacterized membrane protein
MLRYLQLGAITSLILLIILSLAWEGFLSPLKPHGSSLILKSIPLLFPLFGILRGKRYTYQWASLFILIYFTEGIVRSWSDEGLSKYLAMLEIFLTVFFFICAIYYSKMSRPQSV